MSHDDQVEVLLHFNPLKIIPITDNTNRQILTTLAIQFTRQDTGWKSTKLKVDYVFIYK